MTRSANFKNTVRASSIGYIIQSMVNTFAPLLFVTFQNTYQISLAQVTTLIALNFAAQILFDLIASATADKVGYRRSVITAHIMIAVGVSGLAWMPEVFPTPFAGLCTAALIYGAGGGLTEVLLTPIVEACPIERKDKAVSMLHAFYCWGSVIVIVLSTLFFRLAGIQNWKILACLWAVLPVFNAIFFATVPMYQLVAEGERMTFGELARDKIFWLLLIFMFCAGSCEMAIAQWASAFAEEGLGVSKSVGDLAGPCLFAAMKGIERTWYGKKGNEAKLWRFMLTCAVLCAVCYFVIGLTGSAAVALVFCAIAGFSTGVMWPGTFSSASKLRPRGGTAMFGFLALAGDVGCGAGPAITGAVATAFGDNLKAGFLFGAAFPMVLIIALVILRRHTKRSLGQNP